MQKRKPRLTVTQRDVTHAEQLRMMLGLKTRDASVSAALALGLRLAHAGATGKTILLRSANGDLESVIMPASPG